MNSNYLPLILAMTGASGAVYFKTLFDELIRNRIDLHLVFSANGRKILKSELGINIKYFEKPDVIVYENNNLASSISSGSFNTGGMVIIPATMGTIGRIASGVSIDLVSRAADVVLKEKRKLIIVPRESPFNTIHLENMTRLSRMGAVIMPASPGFYHSPSTVEDLVSFLVARVLNHLGIHHQLMDEWKDNTLS